MKHPDKTGNKDAKNCTGLEENMTTNLQMLAT